MALVIEAIQAARLRLRDTATGKTIVQDVEAGGEWVCVEPSPAGPAAQPKVEEKEKPAAAAKPATTATTGHTSGRFHSRRLRARKSASMVLSLSVLRAMRLGLALPNQAW